MYQPATIIKHLQVIVMTKTQLSTTGTMYLYISHTDAAYVVNHSQ